MKVFTFSLLAAALFGICGSAHSAAEAEPTRATLTQALNRFLAERGEICVGKYDWPIDVSARDVAKRSRDSIQLPVLEQQGLVSAREGVVVYKDEAGEESVPTRRYELSEQGQRFYKAHDVTLHPHGVTEIRHDHDLCAGRLELDSIVKLEAPHAWASSSGSKSASVSYLYRFKAERWVLNDEVRRVFPMIDMLMQGQGKTPMQQSFHFDGKDWVADTNLDGTAP